MKTRSENRPSILWTAFRSVLMAFSLTIMGLAAVYALQAREARDAAPMRIGETREERSFFADYGEARTRMVLNFVNDMFPDLAVPEVQPEEPPTGNLSLKALHSRAAADRFKAQQQGR